MTYRPKDHTASLMINGSRAYLVGAHRLGGKVYIELSYDKDFAHRFANLYNARVAREAIASGQFSDAVIWRSNVVR